MEEWEGVEGWGRGGAAQALQLGPTGKGDVLRAPYSASSPAALQRVPKEQTKTGQGGGWPTTPFLARAQGAEVGTQDFGVWLWKARRSWWSAKLDPQGLILGSKPWLPITGWTSGEVMSPEGAGSPISSFHQQRPKGFGRISHTRLILIFSAACVPELFLFCLPFLTNRFWYLLVLLNY